MKSLTLLSIIALFPTLISAQVLSCGTEIDNTNIDRLNEYNERWKERTALEKAYGTATFSIPVQIHIIRDDSGSGGISEMDCLRAFDRLNDFYINASIHFYQIEEINFIDESLFYDYDKSQMAALDAAYSETDVLNIYIANTVSSFGNAICGHAQFPGGLDFVMQSKGCMANGSTLAHEVGHYLGLYHTHETSFGDEAVDGTDCSSEGDLLCDTPADPRLNGTSNFNSAGCNYYGTDTDENGEQYDPMVTNVMSYASKECRVDFTEDQLDRILWTLQNERTYLDYPSVLIDVDAFFYVAPIVDCYNVTAVEFYNASHAGDDYLWDFGDGSATSTDESPSHIYVTPGIYDVTLTTTDFLGATDTYVQAVSVGSVNLPYSNDFENGTADIEIFNIQNSWKNQVSLSTDAAESGSFGMLLDGTEITSSSPSFKTPSVVTAFEELWNPYYKSEVSLCVNATGFTGTSLDFDKRQIRTSNDNYTHLRVLVNGVQINSVISVESPSSDDVGFTNYSFDLSAYDGTVFTLTIEGSHKYSADYNGSLNGSASMIDNILIDGFEDPAQVGLGELSVEGIKAYPNPTSGSLIISASSEIESTPMITSPNGKDLSSSVGFKRTTAASFFCDINQLASGVYLVKVCDEVIRVVKK